MKYNFKKIINRKDTDSTKWNILEGELPLWIADMDFKTCPAVIHAIEKRVKNGIFGYTDIPSSWYQAYIDFYRDRYSISIKKEWLMFSLGVIPTISSSVRKLTSIGDNIVVLPPVYNIFYNSIINNQRNVLEVPLLRKEGEYFIDFENLEKAFADKKTTMIIFCNPANPVSKIWPKEDLIKLGELAKKYNVIVLSDEIHGFLTRPGTSYIPFFSVNEVNRNNSVTCISVTKAFNLAGIHTSAIIASNSELFKKVNRQINTDEVAEPNAFSCISAIAALNDGREWLDELRSVIFSNRDYVETYIKEKIPELEVIKGDATYLLWIDATKVCADSSELVSYLRKTTGLYLSDGKVYGLTGNGFLRMNVACPKAILDDALSRLEKGIKSFIFSNK